jgi:hypothetical protein
MNVITNASSIRSRVIVTEDLQSILCEFTDSHLSEERDEVSGLSSGVFTDLTGFVSSSRVEVPQSDDSPLVGRVAKILEDLFSHDLGSSVAGFGLERRSFGNGDNGRSSVNGSRGRVDEVVYLVLLHNLFIICKNQLLPQIDVSS